MSTTPTTVPPTAVPAQPGNRRQDPTRNAARIAGWFYIATFVFSIPTLAMKTPMVDNADFVLGAGASAPVVWAALFDVITGLTGMATAIALYAVLRRRSANAALGFVVSRTLEAAILFVGALSILSLVSLRDGVSSGADEGALLTSGDTLVALHDWSFVLGPGVMPAINALFFGYVLYRTGLVPRILPTLGLIGAPLLLTSSVATMFGAWETPSAPSMVFALPIAVWELSVGIYMIAKGFRPSALAALESAR